MPEKKSEWALNLSTELKKWLPYHGYKTSIQLADELNIPRIPWNAIFHGNGIVETGRREFDGRIFYARINLWTGLAEADPRNIPDRIRVTRGKVKPESRSFSDDEYQQWLKSPEARELLVKKNARFEREMIMESTPPQLETVGSFIGSFIDNLIDRGADQVAKVLLESQKDAVSPQISDLAGRITTLESAIARLVQSQTDRISTPQPRISRSSSDIGQLAIHLRNLLDGYKQESSDDRDKLMQAYGRDLMALDMVVHTLTRRPNEREEMLRLAEETKI